jgi:hypothetical protein
MRIGDAQKELSFSAHGGRLSPVGIGDINEPRTN